jgi:UDP-N-acetylglucosamine--N-acetylmuramyl-(pentapeptide) pyrophosphoryl-undecaprenol N-acetylglucosamine transferase
MSAPTAIFAGGGSGGHIFPNVAIAERLRDDHPNLRAIYLVSDRAVDRAVARAQGLDARPLPAKPLVMTPRGLFRFITTWGPSVRAARRFIREANESGPVVMIASGGFVSAPAIAAARAERVWSCLVNLDATLGKANRLGARFTPHRFVVASEAPSGWTAITPVVRPAFAALSEPAAARIALGLEPAKPTLLVTGGSQGAASITRGLAAALRDRPGLLAGWQALHQAAPEHEAELADAYASAGANPTIIPFIERMPEAWAAASLAVARGGAGTIAEAWASRTPVIVLPYPHHHDAHQAANARPLESAGAAVIVEDRVEPDRTAPDLAQALEDAVARLETMSAAARRLPPARGAEEVARAAAAALRDA